MIVNVTSLPSATLEVSLVTVNVGEADELIPLLEIVTSELPAVEPDEGKSCNTHG